MLQITMEHEINVRHTLARSFALATGPFGRWVFVLPVGIGEIMSGLVWIGFSIDVWNMSGLVWVGFSIDVWKEIEGIMSGDGGWGDFSDETMKEIKGSRRRGWDLKKLFRRSLEKWREMIVSGEDWGWPSSLNELHSTNIFEPLNSAIRFGNLHVDITCSLDFVRI